MMVFQFVGIQIFSVMYLLLILIVYSSKKRYVSVENSIFKILLVFTLFELLLDISVSYSIRFLVSMPIICNILCKISLVGYHIWAAFLMLYVILLGNNKNYKSFMELLKKSWKCQVCTIVVFLLAFVIFLLPISYIYDETYNISYITGICTSYTYFVTIAYLFIILVTALINKNKVSFSKRIPIFTFIITSSIFLPIQRFNADVPVLIVPLMAFAIMIMYFTLENPDLKLIKELNDLKLKAEESIKVKSKFLDNVSYNMKTPMNTIVGFSQTLLEEELPKNARYDAENIVVASKNLLEMVDNTLDISKIESGVFNINNDNYELSDLIKNLYYTTNRLIKNEKVKLIFNIDSTIPSRLLGDYNKLSRVLNNVLGNAVKYTNVGKIIFSVTGISEGDYLNLRFKISDTGIGIKEENFEKIFNKFGRIDDEEAKNVAGTGLGLALSKDIIELLGGTISFDSTYGAGTIFYIELKQKIVDKKPIGELNLNNVNINKIKYFDCSLKKILVIDGNVNDINVLRRMLKNYNIKLDESKSHGDCTKLLDDKKEYDLIFLDDKIADENIFKIIKTLEKNCNRKIILVGLTSDTINKTKNYFINNGYDDYLSKPIDIVALNKLLEKYLNQNNK